MMNFKTSMLLDELVKRNALSADASDYVDACTDDWEVEYKIDFRALETIYTLRVPMDGYHLDRRVELTATYVGDLNAMAALIEYLAHVNLLLLNDCGIDTDL